MRIWLACLALFIGLWAGGVLAAPVILVYGDSLSAAYGIPRDQGWVALLERRLAEEGLPHQVINASVSGETTSGGLYRLPTLIEEHHPALLILALGANDGLRGLPLEQTADNLEAIVKRAKRERIRVLLIGMHLPPNYGPAYTRKFHALFREVAQRQKVRLVPFLLEGVATRPELFLPDGLHPGVRAQPRLLDNVWPELMPLLR